MQNSDNQKTYFIYVRSTGEKVPVSKAQHDAFYKEADRIRHKEQDHGRCMCPYRFIWKCNGDCLDCEYHAAGNVTSLDQPLPDGNGTLGDYIPDRNKPMEEVIADRMLLEQLFARLRELDPEADTIIQLWKDHLEGISDRARVEANLKLAQHDFKPPPLLTDTEIEVILGKVDELVSWASDIKEYALQQALSGKEWTGFKLVEGRSNRRYSNEAAVIDAAEKAGFDPYEKKLLCITAMQKLLGKSRFDELLTAYIEKPQGKPTLVPDSDKRPAMNTAKNDFMEENDNE